MKRNEILEIARQTGLEDTDFPFDEWEPVELIAFAKLVAAKEREACAKAMQPMLRDMISRGQAAEIIRARGEA